MAGQLGYCGLDRLRQPLRGDEVRSCWEAADATGTIIPALPGVGPVWPLDPDLDRTTVRPLQFVEVEPRPSDGTRPAPAEPAAMAPPAGEPRWSLWTELEA